MEAMQMQNDKPIFDLDEIIEKPIVLRLHGRNVTIKAIQLEQWLLVASAFADMKGLQMNGGADPADLKKLYFKLFSSVCDEITYEDVENMSNAQLGAMTIFIMRRLEGESEESLMAMGAQKKKS